MARPVDEALIGRTIAGKFVVESFIGGGAMGAVYRAKQLSLDKTVAVKVLHPDLQDATFIARFQREAKAASRLDHPNSMRVLDYGRDADGLCYIAMEFLDGHSLFRILKDASGPLPEARTVDLTCQILAALAAAHDIGIIHRDLKPENIIVVPAKGDEGNAVETVKVCDFGMAKMMATEAGIDTSVSEKLTSRGIVVGTPEYMSPEQGKGEELDARSDLYSVGVILYQMLAGRLPFEADTPIATLIKHMVEVPRAPLILNPDVHPELEAICLRALSKAREDRFGSAREMRAALRAALDVPLTGPSSPALEALARAGRDSGPDAAVEDAPISLPHSSAKQTAARSPFLSDPDDAPAAPLPPRRRAVELVESVAPRRKSSSTAVVAAGLVLLAGAGVVVALRITARATPAVDAQPASTPAAVSPSPEPRPAPETPPITAPPSVTPSPSAVASNEAKPLGPAAAPSKGGKAAETAANPPAPAPGRAAASGTASSASSVGAPAAHPSPAAAAPAPAAPAAAGPYDKASVSFGSVRTNQAQAADVTAALPSSRFNQCYREGLRAKGSPVRGAGMLHIVFDGDGHVTESSFAGPPDLASVGQCVAGAAIGSNIKNVASGGGSGAEVDLSFKPD